MKKNHLSLLGIGPLYVITIVLITFAGIMLSYKNIIPYIDFNNFKVVFVALGVLTIILGVFIWIRAVVCDKLDKHIIENKLLINGIFAYVRNPVYSAFMFVCTGAIFIYGNILLFILPLVYWGYMTVLLKHTEEIWLKSLYGEEYIQYCNKVNRCIPFFKK